MILLIPNKSTERIIVNKEIIDEEIEEIIDLKNKEIIECLKKHESQICENRQDQDCQGKFGEVGCLQFLPTTFYEFCVIKYKIAKDDTEIKKCKIQEKCADRMIQDGFYYLWTTIKFCKIKEWQKE